MTDTWFNPKILQREYLKHRLHLAGLSPHDEYAPPSSPLDNLPSQSQSPRNTTTSILHHDAMHNPLSHPSYAEILSRPTPCPYTTPTTTLTKAINIILPQSKPKKRRGKRLQDKNLHQSLEVASSLECTCVTNSDFTKYADTLPFDFLSAKSVDDATFALRRTWRRWKWFEDAAALDKARGTGLGTLGYLPWEIRQIIYQMIIEIYQASETASGFRRWYGNANGIDGNVWTYKNDPPPQKSSFPFCSCSYYPGHWHATHEFLIRRASPTLKEEFEHAFLSGRTFRFHRATKFAEFLSRLDEKQASYLRFLRLNLYAGPNFARSKRQGRQIGEEWLQSCTQLPGGLTCVEFDITNKYGESFKFTSNLLEILTKQVMRSCPRVKCKWIGNTTFTEKQQRLLDEVVRDVD